MNRRDFCQKIAVVGGVAVLVPALNACNSIVDQFESSAGSTTRIVSKSSTLTPQPTVTRIPTKEATPSATAQPDPVQVSTKQDIPTPTNEPMTKTAVALVKTEDRHQGVLRALALLNPDPIRGQAVFLKPNFNSADRVPGSTDPAVLQALTEYLYESGAKGITVGDRSGMGNTRTVMEQKGILSLADELGFATLVFDELEDNDWILHQSTDHYWSKGFALPKPFIESECVVQTCNLKTHRYGGHFTMSLKNSVGLVAKEIGSGHNFMDELHHSPYQRKMIADINSAYTPHFIVMDGVDAFSEGGPATGKLIHPGVVLAGTDRIAIDAIGVAILRLFGTTPEVNRGAIFEQEQISRAVELGLGIQSPDEIEIVTADEDSSDFARLVAKNF